MSSFQLNLSALTLGARERLARLDAAGGAVKALLSPSPSGSGPSAMALSAPVAALSAGVASLPSARSLPSDSRVSIEQLVAGGGGRSGEFSLAGGLSGGLLSVFVATPDLLDKMCLGAVAGGVKFCTLDETSCTFSTHAKKVAVRAGSIYISTGRQSAFAHHYAPTVSLSSEQLEGLLEERHTKEEWIRLLLGLRQGSDGVDVGSSPGATNPVNVLNGVTPGRKRKVRYEDELRLGTQTPSRGGLGVSLKDSFDSEGE
jgi:hypothetical protein